MGVGGADRAGGRLGSVMSRNSWVGGWGGGEKVEARASLNFDVIGDHSEQWLSKPLQVGAGAEGKAWLMKARAPSRSLEGPSPIENIASGGEGKKVGRAPVFSSSRSESKVRRAVE